MADFLDTLKVLGTSVKDAAVDTAKNVATNAAQMTAGAAIQAIQTVGQPKTTATGAVAQPPVGTNANGTPIVTLPPDTKTNAQGQIVAPAESAGVPVWVWYAGGGFLLLVGGLITYKVVMG